MKRLSITRQLMALASEVETLIRHAVPNGWVTESERRCFLDDDSFPNWRDKAFFIARHDNEEDIEPSASRKDFLWKLRDYEEQWQKLVDQL